MGQHATLWLHHRIELVGDLKMVLSMLLPEKKKEALPIYYQVVKRHYKVGNTHFIMKQY